MPWSRQNFLTLLAPMVAPLHKGAPLWAALITASVFELKPLLTRDLRTALLA